MDQGFCGLPYEHSIVPEVLEWRWLPCGATVPWEAPPSRAPAFPSTPLHPVHLPKNLRGLCWGFRLPRSSLSQWWGSSPQLSSPQGTTEAGALQVPQRAQHSKTRPQAHVGCSFLPHPARPKPHPHSCLGSALGN